MEVLHQATHVPRRTTGNAVDAAPWRQIAPTLPVIGSTMPVM